MHVSSENQLNMRQLLAFFIPLGVSASLVTISHVIINSTLARSAQPEIVIASYAIAMSILGITERPAVLLRHTCSALVRDRISFRAMSTMTWYILSSIILLGLIISYTPVGEWVFVHLIGVNESLLGPVLDAYRILMFVSLFSGLRCLYHGVIITNLRTKWLTIGMIIRLAAMYALSLYFISTNQVNSGTVGAIIFLVGMTIECIVSVFEGRSLLKTLPEKRIDHTVEKKRQVFQFYRPLLYSSFIAVVIGPAINAALGKTTNIELSIASFAIAASLTQLVSSFFSYIHQIVLNFYNSDSSMVYRFTFILSFIPSLLLGILCYTPLGPWFMQTVMGINERLMTESLHTLRIFMIMTLIFPWLDFCNGLIMLRGQTKVMVWSQVSNVAVTIVTLLMAVQFAPAWNGMIGALSQSLGFAGEIAVVLYVLRMTAKNSSERFIGKGTA
jgi:hypothetical protein